MKLKKTINFTTLRKEGVNVLDIKDDEVVKITSKNGTKCIVDEKYLLELIQQAKHPIGNFTSQAMGAALNTPIGNFVEKEFSDKFASLANNLDDKFNNLKEDLQSQINNKKGEDDE